MKSLGTRPADDTSPAAAAHRRMAWLAGGLVLAALLLLVLAGSGLWWTLRSDAGTQWLLSRLPGVSVTGGKGALWGDYEAERLELRLPGGGKVVATGVGWRGLRIEHAPAAAYRARIAMNELHARRVDVELPVRSEPRQPAAGPPAHLRLPVELAVQALRIGELHAGPLGDKPVRDLRAQLHAGAQNGSLHRVDGLALAWDRLQASGAARVGADAPFPLELKVDVAQAATGHTPAWRAAAALSGPLAQPLLTGTVRTQAAAGRPVQSLDLRAVLRPFEPWPLGELQASTRALDLSVLHSAAPTTSLTGTASAHTTALDQPATVTIRMSNAEAGRWNERRLPVREIALDLRARPDDPRTLDLQTFDAQLGTAQQPGGRLQGRGHWTPQQWTLQARLDAVEPSALDARAAAMQLTGPLDATGRGFDRGLEGARIDLQADLAGRFADRRTPRPARLKFDGVWALHRIELREALATAAGARASLAGVASRDAAGAPWHVKANGALVDFDPVPWWPGREDSAWRKGRNRLNATTEIDLTLPTLPSDTPVMDRAAALRGRAQIAIARSTLAGVPLAGELALRSTGGAAASVSLTLDAAANTLQAQGRLDTRAGAAADHWELTLAAPSLHRLAALWRLGPASAAEGTLAGSVSGKATVRGRWPAIASEGEATARDLSVGQTGMHEAQARWRIDMQGGPPARAADPVIDVQASLAQLTFSQAAFKGVPPIESARLQVQGTMRSHSIELRADTRAVPPAWTDSFQPRPAPGARSLAVLVARGGALAAPAGSSGWTGWRGRVQQAELASTAANTAPWLRTRDVDLEFQWAGAAARLAVQPGRAEVLGNTLRWSRVDWQAASGGRPAQIDAQAELEPVAIAPLLARLQPGFGWGGDLAIAGRVNLHSAAAFTADIVLERQRGDLTVTDETGNTQALGLTDLRLALDVRDGVWSFTQGLAGKTLGVAAGAVIAHTSPQATWPSPDTPIQGVLEVQVANLGTWGPWVPAGWRLAGALRTSAGIGGRFGAPQYTGQVHGSGIGVRNFLLGVDVRDGDVAIELQGDTARIERFTARAGSGSMRVEGNAVLGEAPKASLRLQAEQFQLLGRVDRRIVASGEAQMQLDRDTLALDGRFAIDEGLIDFTRSDAPRLSDDVVVVRRPGPAPAEPTAPSASPAPGHAIDLDVRVALGEQLRLRGRGIDTGLRGDLHITSPNNKLTINGSVRTAEGTYAAYGQKLAIERGVILFNGPVENPRLDIEATRPDLDVRVGVLVSGTALDPRIRLFSEPDMPEMDKLSWLVLGRGGDELGRTDTALLQRAALALLAGEGEGTSDQFTKALGLDDLSLRQTEGEVRETVVSLGKQLSRRWYVGYERSLSATAGSWQLIYRIARRFTLRAQTGEDSSLDVIWTWRWD